MLALECFIPRLANHSIRVLAFTQSIRISFGKEHKHSNHLSSTSLPAQVYLLSSAIWVPSPDRKLLRERSNRCLKSQVGKAVEQALNLPILCKQLLGSEESYLHSGPNAHRFNLGNKSCAPPTELLTVAPHRYSPFI